MKKFLIVLSSICAFHAASSAQTLTISNNNACGATIEFQIAATDASLACPAQTTIITVPSSTLVPAEAIHDFDAAGAGPNYWLSGGSIGASASWILAQCVWVGGSASTVIGSSSSPCWSAPIISSITSGGCTVNLAWKEDPFGNVLIHVF